MADVIISPLMQMPVPIPAVTPGPAWATDTNACFGIVDGHDHSQGTGNQITPNGLNISSDLTFLSNNAIAIRSIRFSPQSGSISNPSDVGCLYEAGVDLYYNDGAGNPIRITQGGSVTGASGTITGLPSGTASASFSGTTFTFQSSTNTSANGDFANVVLRNLVASSKGLTLSAPSSLAADYQIFFPLLPIQKGIVTLNSAGNMNVEPAVAPVNSVVTTNVSGDLGTQPLYFDITVGPGGSYSTIGAAITAASNDQTILITGGTYTENVIVNKRLFIQGKGYATQLNGNLTFTTGSNDGVFKDLRVSGTVTLGVPEITFTGFYTPNKNLIINNSRYNIIQGFEE